MSRFDDFTPQTKFKVFVIGPMGRKERFRFSRRVRLGDHIPNIQIAANEVLREIGLRPDQFEVQIPNTERGRDIVEDVFFKMDEADFAIVDISGLSPNVFYELAFFDSLGVPSIIFSRNEDAAPFYLKNNRIAYLNNFSVPRIKPALQAAFEGFFNDTDVVQQATNPITRFYQGTSLIDVSAASGVAIGYFVNFLKPVLYQGQGTVFLPENKVNRVVIVRPERINSMDRADERVRAQLDGAQRVTLKAPLHPRKEVTAEVFDNAIIDFPTPLASLVNAPRYRKLLNVLSLSSVTESAREGALIKLEQRFIASYIRTLQNLLKAEQALAANRLIILPVRDLKENGLRNAQLAP